MLRPPPALHARARRISSVTICRLRALASAVRVLASGAGVSAHYVRRHRVQYKRLGLQVLQTEHVAIYFCPGEREGVGL